MSSNQNTSAIIKELRNPEENTVYLVFDDEGDVH